MYAPLSAIKTLFSYLWIYKWRICFAAGMMILAKVANISIPLILKEIIDSLDVDKADIITLPLVLLLAYGGLRLCTSIFNQFRDLIFAKAALNTIANITVKVFEHLQYLSLTYHLNRKTGGLSRDIDRGSRSVNELLRIFVFSIFPTLFELTAVCVILLYRYQPRFVIVTLATILSYGLFTYYISDWRLKFRKKMNETDTQANSTAIDALINYETVKYFTNEALETNRYDNNLKHWRKASYQSEMSLAILNIGQALIIATGLTVLLVMAGQNVVDGIMTLGDFVLVNAFLLQLYVPLNFLGYVFRTLQNSLVDIARMFSLLEIEQEYNNAQTNKALQVKRGKIEFNNVSFSYKENRSILENVNITIPGGSKVAIVGHSGAGKSTIARLLFRFYLPNEGYISIDGQNINELNLKSLRQNIGVVPQDTVLFNDTIEYNIAYGRADADKSQIIQAAKSAYLHDFIESLPEGYQTMVGERGLKLSGGEKQRLAIARTILKNPPILLLDEATSALDSKSEEAIQKALNNIVHQTTTVVIAHRLSTIMDADQIVVLDNGKVIESGNHQQLLEKHSHYAKMWQLQQNNESSLHITL